jgi:hypothetical protein
MFALIERNEHDLSLQSSQSSKGSREMLADNIDVIRLHSVVQGFFSDTLLADKDHKAFPMWLDRAVRVFCCSYDMASERIARKINAGLVEDYRLYEIHGIRLREHITRHEKKIPMADTLAMLTTRLMRIKREIEQRTPESSTFIAGGGPHVFQTSIFDRTGSSSDTGPETPGDSDRGPSRISTWGLDPDQIQHESPTNIHHQDLGLKLENHFPPHVQDDTGYDSDLEVTAQPSPRTIKPQESPTTSDGIWETIPPRRKPRSTRFNLGDHRTTRNLGRQKYSDRAGSFRSLKAIDPRTVGALVTRETARGYLYNNSSRPQSDGRVPGQSNAEVALIHISQTSPPPVRDGGTIQDRRSLPQRSNDRERLVAGTASYAAAVSSCGRDAVTREDRPVSEPQIGSNENKRTSTLEQQQSSALESLKQFPVSVVEQPPNSNTLRMPFTPMPPYPLTPEFEYQLQYPQSDTSLHQLSGRHNQDNLLKGPDLSLSNAYPRLNGPVPFQRADTPPVPRDCDSQQDYPGQHSHTNPEGLQLSIHAAQDSPFLSLSSPNIRPGREETYYPGHPEFSSQAQTHTYEEGYTSQPMSRGPSGQSAHSEHSHQSRSSHVTETGRRRPSLAETEPPPQLPDFSPRYSPTSYELYERRRDFRERVAVRTNSRLEFSKLSERLDAWTLTDREK